MGQIKCANCSKKIYQGAKSCPYCGIKYVDMTHVDPDDTAPIVLMLKLPTSHGNAILTQIAVPQLDETSVYVEDEKWQDIYSVENSLFYKLKKSCVLHTHLAFTSVCKEDRPIYTLHCKGESKDERHRLCDQAELRYQ